MSRLLLAAALALTSTAALAQTPVQGGVIAGLQGGPAIPGVCLLSQEEVLTASKVSQAVNQRVAQLAQAAQAEIDAARKPIDDEAKALQADTKIKPADREKRVSALQVRYQPLQTTANLRNREIALTREKALVRVATEAQPLIVEAYKAHSCGLLLNRAGVMAGNMANDLTPEVIRALDVKVTSIPIERETIPAGK